MPSPSANAAPAVSRRAFRIVVFGMPDAGKSSLLGALAQAAQTQEQVLHGKLIDKTHGLMELQLRLYEDRPRETLEEVTQYPIAVEPFFAKTTGAGQAIEAVLVDCDGRVAKEILDSKDALIDDQSQRALTQAVLSADALVLAVDGSVELPRLKSDFALFSQFLRMLEESRGQRAEIGGMPVYLVLTKCDKLAHADDTQAGWIDRIEEHKREVYERFKEFLAEEAASDEMPFGKIDLHIWATAVKRPALAGAPARPKEPYGVAELFRQCLDSAGDFRARHRFATERLAWTVGLMTVLVGFLVLLALFFIQTRAETELVRFEKELRSFSSAQGVPAVERLREPLTKTITELQVFRSNPLFEKMPPDLQKQVVDQLREAEAYDKFSKEWQAAIKAERLREAPRFAQTQAELDAFRKVLKQHPLPADYRTAWHDTVIAGRQRQWQDEIEVMETEIKAAVQAIAELQELDAKVKDRKKYTGEQLDSFMEELKLKDRNLPYRKDNLAPVRNSRVTYGNVAQFDAVAVPLARYAKTRADNKLDGSK